MAGMPGASEGPVPVMRMFGITKKVMFLNILCLSSLKVNFFL